MSWRERWESKGLRRQKIYEELWGKRSEQLLTLNTLSENLVKSISRSLRCGTVNWREHAEKVSHGWGLAAMRRHWHRVRTNISSHVRPVQSTQLFVLSSTIHHVRRHYECLFLFWPTDWQHYRCDSDQIKMVDSSPCVTKREIWAVCPSHRTRGKDVRRFGAAVLLIERRCVLLLVGIKKHFADVGQGVELNKTCKKFWYACPNSGYVAL